MISFKTFVSFLLINILVNFATSADFKPVVIIHGLLDRKTSLDTLKSYIEQQHEGTNVTLLTALHGWKSITPLWYQVRIFSYQLDSIMKQNPDGIVLIGYSQGGLIARALIETSDSHNVDTFISLSSPQGGQFGDGFLRILFPNYVKETAWKVLYTKAGQLISVSNYWRDPHHVMKYLTKNVFLPIVDNAIYSKNSSRFRRNFLKLRKLVLIGGPDDGVIDPWQSSHFGCYDSKEEYQPMESREIFRQDSFGLRTLKTENKIYLHTVSGVHHHEWHQNTSVIDECILPYLKS